MIKQFFFPFLLLAATSLLVFSACQDDEAAMPTGELSIDFNALYDGAALDIQSMAYDYPDGSKIKIQLFQYYISDLELLPADGGAPVSLAEIDLIRYNTAGANNVRNETYINVPAGEYNGLRFGLGVKPELNNQQPSNFAADFVLNEAEYWNDNTRYVFAKIEGNVDLNNNGMFDTPVSYHMGSNEVFTTITFNGDISVRENETTELALVADILDALAASDTEFHDFNDPNQRIVHGGNQAIAADIWTRLAEQFRLTLR